MKPHVAKSKVQLVACHQHGQSQYSKVFDQRKRRIRGFGSAPNGAFYAQLTVTDENTGRKIVRRMRMEDTDGNPVPTAAEAVNHLLDGRGRNPQRPDEFGHRQIEGYYQPSNIFEIWMRRDMHLPVVGERKEFFAEIICNIFRVT